MLALTFTLNKLIKKLEEKQSPELVKKYKKKRVVPKKPPPSPHPTGESCQIRRTSWVGCLYPSAGAVPGGHHVLSLLTVHILFLLSRTLLSLLPSSYHCLPFACLPPSHAFGKQPLSMSGLNFWFASVHPEPTYWLAHRYYLNGYEPKC